MRPPLTPITKLYKEEKLISLNHYFKMRFEIDVGYLKLYNKKSKKKSGLMKD